MAKPIVLVIYVATFIVMILAMASADKPANSTIWTPVAGVLECLPSSLPYKIADPMQCDKYYVCRDGTKQEFLCPDGMAFQFPIQSCVYLVQAPECKGILQPPKPSGSCPRQYGYFPTQTPPICNKYLHCQGGVATEITCPDDLVFDPEVGTCDHPNRVNTSYCLSGNGIKSICHGKVTGSGEKLRDPGDCRRFYVCGNETSALLMSCHQDLAFNPATKQCDEASVENWLIYLH